MDITEKITNNNEKITNIIIAEKNSEEKVMDNKQTEIDREEIAEEQDAKIDKMTESIDAKMEKIESTMEKIEATIEGVEVGSAEYQKEEFVSNVFNLSAGLVMAVIGSVLLMKARKIEEKSKKKIAGWILLGLGVATVAFSIAQFFM